MTPVGTYHRCEMYGEWLRTLTMISSPRTTRSSVTGLSEVGAVIDPDKSEIPHWLNCRCSASEARCNCSAWTRSVAHSQFPLTQGPARCAASSVRRPAGRTPMT